MFRTLTPRILIGFTLAIIPVTAFCAWIVISYEPPAFFGYIFGAFSGALWLSLYILFRDYSEGN